MSIKRFYNIGKNDLFSICRSLTGKGLRQSLHIIKKNFPNLKIIKVKSGTKVFDWKVPPEWNVSDAFIIDKNRKKIINFKKNNLHLVGYSIPVNKYVSKSELLKHLHSLPKQPTAIPYSTSYYKRYWGFCLSHNQKIKIIKRYKVNDRFKVVIKTKLNNKGYLNYGQLLIKGQTKKEILISTNLCHPSLANNELSGPIVSMCLMNYFKNKKNIKKTLRFLFIPETIGSIAFLSKNLEYLKKNVIGGFNLSCIGDERIHSCLFTRKENTLSDRALMEAYKKLKIKYKRYSFLERGSDERQYNSPGVDLPIASIFRSKYGEYPEYHTSLDNFDLVTPKGIKGGFTVAKTAISILMNKIAPKYTSLGEPQLGRRGLYPSFNTKYSHKLSRYYLNFLQYADGNTDLISIGKKIKINKNFLFKIYKILHKNNLVD